MTAQIGGDKIDEVRERTDILDVVSRYVTLKRSGANHMGLCPFHGEKTPSFSVNQAQQFYYCFGCGLGGNVYNFLMKIEGLAFPDAVRRLAEQAGIDLEERALSPEEERRQQQRERLFQVNEEAANYFHRCLMEEPSAKPAREYLQSRGYGRNTAEQFRLGYALESWDDLQQYLSGKQLAAEDVRAVGLIRPSRQQRGDYDLFRGRLIFPIADTTGRVVAFGGRVLAEETPKYINSPESPIYHKGRELFGLYQARQAMRRSGDALLVEGYFDQLALQRAGFPQAVATCGTALTSEHARLLKRYAQRVMVVFDEDRAGRQATFRAMGALQAVGLPALVIGLPAGEDPDSFLHRHGREAFADLLEQARPAMELFIEDSLSAAVTVEERARAAEAVMRRIVGLVSPLEQDLYLKELARSSGIDQQLLKQQLDRIRQQDSGRSRFGTAPQVTGLPESSAQAPRSGPERQPASDQKPDWSRAEGLLLQAGLLFPEKRGQLLELADEAFVSAPARTLASQIGRSAKTPDDPTLLEDVAVEYRQVVARFLDSPREEFEGAFEGLLAALRREIDKKQYRELREQMEAAARSGDENLQIKLQREFTQLKKRLQL